MARDQAQLFYDCIPQENRNKLDTKLDADHDGVQRHLGEIANAMDEWEGSVADALELTKVDVVNIRSQHRDNVSLQTRAALQKWQENNGFKSTYRNLIVIFLKAGKTSYAEAVCKVLGGDPSQIHGTPIRMPATTTRSTGTRLRTNTHYHDLYHILAPYSNHWRAIGLALGFFPNELTIIQSNVMLMTQGSSGYLSEMITKWLQWAPGDGRGSRNFATYEDLIAALLKVPGTASIAYDLGPALGIQGGNIYPPLQPTQPPQPPVYTISMPAGSSPSPSAATGGADCELSEEQLCAQFMEKLQKWMISKKDRKTLIENGITTWEIFKHLTSEDMKEMGISMSGRKLFEWEKTRIHQEMAAQAQKSTKSERQQQPRQQQPSTFAGFAQATTGNPRSEQQQYPNFSRKMTDKPHPRGMQVVTPEFKAPLPVPDGWNPPETDSDGPCKHSSYSPYPRVIKDDRTMKHTPKLKLDEDPKLLTKLETDHIQLPWSLVGNYPMKRACKSREKGHGLALIINNETFASPRHKQRLGTYRDEYNLVETFRFLGYRVEIRRDCSKEVIEGLFEDISPMIEEEDDSFVCCILSHGSNNIVYGSDSKCVILRTEENSLEVKLSKCTKLKGKPKLFFVSACGVSKREAKSDGDEDMHELEANSYQNPSADFVLNYATPPGEASWRYTDTGTFYINKLCQVLCENATKATLSDIQKMVAQVVSGMERKQQMPSIEEQMSRNVFFFDDFFEEPTEDITTSHTVDDFFDSYAAKENRRHYNAYQQALKNGLSIALKYIKMVMLGPPRTGKSSMKKRLLGEIINLQAIGQATQPSTGTASAQHVIVKPAEDRMKTTTALISETQTECAWSAVGNKKDQSDIVHLDEELCLLYNFIIERINLQKKHEQATCMNITEEETMQTVSEETKPTTDDQETSTTSSDTNAEVGHIISNDIVEPVRKTKKISISEMKEIEDIFKAFNKILETGAGRQQLKVLLEKTILLNMVDTGGQPAFIEMLPLLTIGPALYLIFLRLDQELKQRYDIEYVSEDNEKVFLGRSSYTLQEVIFQVLSSILCFKSFPSSPKQVFWYSQAAMLVGTYKDKLKGSPEEVRTKIKKIDSALQSDLHLKGSDLNQEHRNMFQYAFPHDDQLILDADNMTGDEEEVKTIRKRLEQVISREFSTPEIPASWLMFGLFLQRMGKCTTSISQCEEVGRRLHMNDVREAIWFLHHCIGVLMYYPDVEELKDIVICDPQMVFNSVTELILNSFTLKRVKKVVRDNFKLKGQFCFSDIDKISTKILKSGILPLPQLVKLLEHRYIIARISHHASTSTPNADAVSSDFETPLSASISEVKNVTYFMPAILLSAQDSELNMTDSKNPVDPAPLLIRFKSGIVPVGMYCACIASLVAQREQLNWILMDPTQSGYILYKDRVTFRVNISSRDYDVTLICKPKQYEVHITQYPSSTSEQPSHDICQHVLENVCCTLDDVISKIRYNGFIFSPFDCREKRETPYELGFRCPLHPDAHDEHMAVFTPYRGQPSQTALELLLDYSKNKTKLFCLHEKRTVNLKELLQSSSVSECQAACFYKKCCVWMGPNYYVEPSEEEIFTKTLQEEWKIPEKDIAVLKDNGIISKEIFYELIVENLKEMKLSLGGRIILRRHLSDPPCLNDTASSSLTVTGRDYVTICEYLCKMERIQIERLGGELGLDPFKLKNMKNLPDDMVLAWLRKEDNVAKELTWTVLVEALRRPVIGQNGIADQICRDKCYGTPNQE